jgi:hypothetical protein
MTKRIWKLYKEVRRLRNKVKTLEADCGKANYDKMMAFQEVNMWRQYVQEHKVQLPYDTVHIIVPNMYGLETVMDPTRFDQKPRAEFLMKRMTDNAKIHVMDDLIAQGYFRKVRDDVDAEIYEIKVIR